MLVTAASCRFVWLRLIWLLNILPLISSIDSFTPGLSKVSRPRDGEKQFLSSGKDALLYCFPASGLKACYARRSVGLLGSSICGRAGMGSCFECLTFLRLPCDLFVLSKADEACSAYVAGVLPWVPSLLGGCCLVLEVIVPIMYLFGPFDICFTLLRSS